MNQTSPEKTPTHSATRRWIIQLGVLTLVIIGISLYFTVRGYKKNYSLGEGEVTRGDLVQKTTFSGFIASQKKSIIAAPYSGYLQKLHVKIGDKVSVGQPLVSIAQSLLNQDPTFPLRAPLKGTVVQIEKAEGENVKEGDFQNFILRIDDLDKMYVQALAPEFDRARLKIGQEVKVKISSLNDRVYSGVIRTLALAAKETGNSRSQVEFAVRIEILDPDVELRPGLTAIVDVITEKRVAVLILRQEFVNKRKEQYFVTLKSGEMRDIQVGLQNEDSFEILSGLKEGDTVQQVDFSKIASPTLNSSGGGSRRRR